MYKLFPMIVDGIRADFKSLRKHDFSVRYLKEQERESFRVLFLDGLCYRHPLYPGPDAGKLIAGAIHEIFVMDEHGQFYLSPKRKNIMQHSSFFAGGPVAGAGVMTIIGGVLRNLYPHSGHYMPDPRMHAQVIEGLEKFNLRGWGSLAEESPTTLFNRLWGYMRRRIAPRYDIPRPGDPLDCPPEHLWKVHRRK